MMRNTWGSPVDDHQPENCHECRGSGTYKTPVGCRGDECEDEDNCYCDCHAPEPVIEGKTDAH